VADVLSTSLDLDTTLRRVAEVVRKVIDYEILPSFFSTKKPRSCAFASSRLPGRFCGARPGQAGRGRHGAGCTVKAGGSGRRCHSGSDLYRGRTQRALRTGVPLITKNRVIGVIDLEARNPGYFTEEHSRLLTLVASRIAGGIENAQLYTGLRGKPAFCSCSMKLRASCRRF